MKRSSKGRRILLRVSAMALALVAADRLAMILLLEDGTLGGRRLAPYATAAFGGAVDASVRRLEESGGADLDVMVFDPELGWEPLPSSVAGADRIDRFGARSARPGQGRPKGDGLRRVAAFGCSFTFGTEVAGDEAWPARLDKLRDDIEVLNMGVPGYGMGQALLRMERRIDAIEPDEVWIALMPTAGKRASTHMFALVRPWTMTPWFKPRFDVDPEGGLLRHPVPVDSVQATVEAFRVPGRFRQLLHGRDPWFDRAGGAFEERPEHALLAGRLFWTWRFLRMAKATRGVDGKGRSLVPLHTAIALEAQAIAASRGAQLRYLILPSAKDMPAPEGDGGVFVDELVKRLRDADIPVLRLGPALAEVPAAERWAAGGHYSPRANDAVARWLAEEVD